MSALRTSHKSNTVYSVRMFGFPDRSHTKSRELTQYSHKLLSDLNSWVFPTLRYVTEIAVFEGRCAYLVELNFMRDCEQGLCELWKIHNFDFVVHFHQVAGRISPARKSCLFQPIGEVDFATPRR